MLNHNINFELKNLLRSGWIYTLIALMIFVIGFATYNGYEKITQRTTDILQAKESAADSDKQMLANIKLEEQGLDHGLPYWKNPVDPAVVGRRHPRLATMDAQPLAILATGQSDMYSHFMKVSTFGNDFALDYAEISNPIQLLFGTFDLSFVFIFILPLLIIAFTYDLLSREKELGTLRMIGSHPISIIKWMYHRLAFRFFLFTGLSTLILILSLALFSPQSFGDMDSVLVITLQMVVYQLFWFILSGIINITVNDSSKNALYLVGCWLLIVLIIPVTVNQISSSFYPAPSRLKMINEIRQANRDIEKKRDEILDSYLSAHPELSSTQDSKDYNFWHKYFASQNVLEEEVRPLVNSYESALHKQQKVGAYMKYISPALILQESFNKIAGSSTDDYSNYKKQVVAYSKKWKDHIIPLLFHDEKYSKAQYDKHPVFRFEPLASKGIIFKNIGAMLLQAGILVLLTLLFYRGRGTYSYIN